MPNSLEEQIVPLVATLEQLAPRESARVSITSTHKPFGYTLTANRDGFIHLAVELLRAATARGIARPHSSEVLLDNDLAHLACRSNQFAGFSMLQALVRDDEIDTPVAMPTVAPEAAPPPPRKPDVAAKLLGAAFLLFALAAVLGFFVVALVVLQQLR